MIEYLVTRILRPMFTRDGKYPWWTDLPSLRFRLDWFNWLCPNRTRVARAPYAEREHWYPNAHYNPGLGVRVEKYSDERKLMRQKGLVPMHDADQYIGKKKVSGKEFLRVARDTIEEKRGSRLADELRPR